MLLEGDPTGEVTGVTWKLLGIGGMAAGAAITWLVTRLNAKEAEIKELNKSRIQDRIDFEAQTNVMVKNIFKLKSGGTVNDS